MEALKRENEWKAFLCNGIAQIINEICGVSRRQIFNIVKSLLSSTLKTFSKDLCLVWFCRTLPQAQSLNMILPKCKQLPNFSACNFIKNETPEQVFSCEFCKWFKNTYFKEHLRAASNDMIFARFFFLRFPVY